jgi:membrane protein required for colicin V production
VNELDYAVIFVMLVSISVGIVRGAIREVINIAGWVAAFILAHAFSGTLAPYFADWMTEPVYRMALAWLALFLAVLVLSSMIASLTSELVRKLGLSSLDRLVGALIGLLRAALLLLVMTLLAGMTKFPQTSMWKNAATMPWLEMAALHARAFLPDSIAARIMYRQAPGRQALQPVSVARNH